MGQDDAVCIRAASERDVSAVRALICATIDACYPPVYCEEAVQFFKAHHPEDKIRERMAEGLCVVLEVGGGIVGTGALVGSDIHAVFVNPACQGRGYGKRIMTHLEDAARENGVEAIKLAASLPSSVFYEFLGYAVTEPASIDFGDGKTLDFHWMMKPLG